MRLYVFDFHGVLEKDNEYAVHEVCNAILSEFGVKREATIKECLMLYGKKWADYYKHFAPHLDNETIYRMVDRSVEIGEASARKHIKPQDYAREVLEAIARAGHTKILMSNTAPKALDFFLDAVGLSDMFDTVYAADMHKQNAHEGNSKEVWLRNYLAENKFDETIVIDDSLVGVEMGMRIGAKTYHFKRGEETEQMNGYAKIGDLRELIVC